MHNNKKYFVLVMLTFVLHITSAEKNTPRDSFPKPRLFLDIKDEKKNDYVEIGFVQDLFNPDRQKSDCDTISEVLLCEEGNYDVLEFGRTQAVYDRSTHFLSVAHFVKKEDFSLFVKNGEIKKIKKNTQKIWSIIKVG